MLLGGATGSVILDEVESSDQVEIAAQEAPGEVAPLILNAPPETDAAQRSVYLVHLYWNRLPSGTTGDVYYDYQRVTITGAPTLEKIAGVAKPPFEGSKLVRLHSAIFVKYVVEDAPGGGPVDENKNEEVEE